MAPNACDACRLRKVKCSRETEQATCRFCTSLGIACHTAPRQRKRAKRTAGSSKPADLASTHSAPPSAEPEPARLRQRPPAPRSQRGARLLGVPGLTRQALDTCIETFFSTVGQVFTLSQPQAIFQRRARVRLYYDSGLDLPAELADVASEPASRLLILAVACRGAPFTSYSSLAEDLYASCARILAESTDVEEDYLDAIDAILLLSELTVQPRHKSAIELDPLGKGTVVDLALYHGLNVAPPPDHPDFLRRLLLFSRVWSHDAIRSASAHTAYRIADEDFGWPLHPGTEDMPYVALTSLTRRICADLLSPIATLRESLNDTVQQVLSSLRGLRERIGVSIDTLNTSLAPEASPETYPPNGSERLPPMGQLFLLSTHDWLHLVVWVAVHDHWDRDPDRLERPVLKAVDEATLAACEDMAALTQFSLRHGLHIRGPRSIRNHMAAFALFLVRRFTEIKDPSTEQLEHHFALAETLNSGVRAAECYEDSERLADTLRAAIWRAGRVTGKDAARVAERGLDGLPSEVEPAAEARASDAPLPTDPTSTTQLAALAEPSVAACTPDWSVSTTPEQLLHQTATNASLLADAIDVSPPDIDWGAVPDIDPFSIDWSELMAQRLWFELPLDTP